MEGGQRPGGGGDGGGTRDVHSANVSLSSWAAVLMFVESESGF